MRLFCPVGLTLLEVVVILALLSVLTVSALPLYYAYVYRATVAVALQKANDMAQRVEDNVKQGRVPFNTGFSAARENGAGFKYQVEGENGQITITATAYHGTPVDAVGKTIVLQPSCKQAVGGVFVPLSRKISCVGPVQWQVAAYNTPNIAGDGTTAVRGVQGTMPMQYVPVFSRAIRSY